MFNAETYLHLHSLKYNDNLAGLHHIALLYEELRECAGHGRSYNFRVAGVVSLGALVLNQVAFEGNFDLISFVVENIDMFPRAIELFIN